MRKSNAVKFENRPLAISEEDYLDHLKIKEAKQNADFVDWHDVKIELDLKHNIISKLKQ